MAMSVKTDIAFYILGAHHGKGIGTWKKSHLTTLPVTKTRRKGR